MVTIEHARRVADISPEWDALFAAVAAQSTRAWFSAIEDAALPPGVTPAYVLARINGLPAVVVPLARSPGLKSLSTPYTVEYAPLVAVGLNWGALVAAGRAIGRDWRENGVILLDAVDPAEPRLAALLDGVAQAGFVVQAYDHFGNWHEPVETWGAYLASRQGSLRETIRRKTAAIEKSGVRLTMAATPGEIGPALEAFEAVYARSWKVAEPFPHFNGTVLPALAELGMVRLGVLWAGDQPIAAQYWTVSCGVGMVLKLAHDDAHKALSPGTVLTAWMIRGLIERDGIRELDFGRGDDPYKRLWASHRRQRLGYVISNPRSIAGLSSIARHRLGVFAKKVKIRLGR